MFWFCSGCLDPSKQVALMFDHFNRCTKINFALKSAVSRLKSTIAVGNFSVLMRRYCNRHELPHLLLSTVESVVFVDNLLIKKYSRIHSSNMKTHLTKTRDAVVSWARFSVRRQKHETCLQHRRLNRRNMIRRRKISQRSFGTFAGTAHCQRPASQQPRGPASNPVKKTQPVVGEDHRQTF